MYAVALRRIDPDRNMARFYAVAVQPTLFGEWAMVRRWGRINTDGRRSETWFADLAPAVACADQHANAKRKRGYEPAHMAPSERPGGPPIRRSGELEASCNG